MKRRQRATAICIQKERILLVRLLDQVSLEYFWIPPGGQIDPGESAQSACVRETFEETGYHVALDPDITVQKSHPFLWMGEEFYSTTDYFFATLTNPEVDQAQLDRRESYIVEHAWFPIAQGIAALTVHPDIRQAAIEVLTKAKDLDRL